ncbi:hypothetical protein KY493_07875 [Brevundimonas sp. PAMC22021]|nr:hypothetical protein KY493_07875 [Brevundimonas sp. PAMC22021]
MPVIRLFTEHPRSVGESYGQHLLFATKTGATLIGAGVACIVHGVAPFLFPKTGSTTIRRLHAQLEQRAAQTVSAPVSIREPAETRRRSRARAAS